MASFLRPAAGSLELLVEGFDRDPVQCRKEIRELAERDPEAFYESAIEVLKARPDSRGAHYVVALLAANGRLLQVLCDRALNRELSLKVVRVAVGMDAMA